LTVEEYQEQLLQDLVGEADVGGHFLEDAFFERACDLLVEAGELVSADRAPHQGARGTGIRVDGYGGDPADHDDTLSLIALDFHAGARPGRLVRTSMEAIFRRMQKFLVSALDSSWRNRLEESSPGFGLADLIAARWSRTRKVRLLLVTNRQLSERVDGRQADDFGGRAVTYSVWDATRPWRQVSEGEAPEEIEIDLETDFGGALGWLPAQPVRGAHESYLTVIPGEVLADIYERWGARLLEQNVRVFLQARNKVNRGMRKTPENEPTLFFAYNNGITGTAEHVEIRNDNGRMWLTGLRNFQIVNGGQTTASVHAARRSKVDVSATFVQMKLSVVDHKRANELVPKISEYANSQNRVNAADFFSNHPFHVRVESFSRRIYAPSPDGTFLQTKWFYERARGQYADARGGLTPAARRRFDLENPRKQFFTKTDLAKFVGVWEGLPHEVSLGAQKNFAKFAQRIGVAWRKSPDDFNEEWYRGVVARAIVFRATERIVSAQDWYQGGYRANIVVYAIAKLAHDVRARKKAVDFRTLWQQQVVPGAMARALARVAKAVHDVLVDPPDGVRNVTEWAKKQACWERARNVRMTWPEDFLESLLSAEEQKAVARSAKKDQRMLNGIEAQVAVVNAGGDFWRNIMAWGAARKLVTPKEEGILRTAAQNMPSARQSVLVLKTLRRLQDEGFPEDLPPSQ